MYKKQMKKGWTTWHDDIPVQLIPEPNISYCRGFSYGLKAVQDHIMSWHKKTFPNANKQAILNKLSEESGELCDEIYIKDTRFNDDEKILNELADVIIVGAALCNKLGVNLSDIIYKKMLINKGRSFGSEDKNGDRERIK